MTPATINLIDRLLLKACRESIEISGQDSKDAIAILSARAEFLAEAKP